MRRSITVDLDIQASLEAVGQGLHIHHFAGLPIMKFASDLIRLENAIDRARPEVIIETGTYAGASALWMSRRPGVQFVITIDADPSAGESLDSPLVQVLAGRSSVDEGVIVEVRRRIRGMRCMVVLDSLHTAAHVTAEIQAYGPLVSPGSMLVVEDGLFDFATPEQLTRWSMWDLIGGGGPLVAIDDQLVDSPDWTRAEDIEADPYVPRLSQCPAGWWVRNA